MRSDIATEGKSPEGPGPHVQSGDAPAEAPIRKAQREHHGSLWLTLSSKVNCQAQEGRVADAVFDAVPDVLLAQVADAEIVAPETALEADEGA